MEKWLCLLLSQRQMAPQNWVFARGNKREEERDQRDLLIPYPVVVAYYV